MHIDVPMAVGGLIVGVIVGLTGMGGGALMTPMLMVVFGVQPLAAVSSDLVASAVMKPVGSFVHLRRRTVHLGVVKWLCLGSVPSAFCGVLITRWLGDGETVDAVVKTAMGVALLFAATMMVVKSYLSLHTRTRRSTEGATAPGGRENAEGTAEPFFVRPLPTVLVGIVGGLIVGMTSVGSGSLIIVALLLMYPLLPASHLVGTDLVQAVPLVTAAAAGHLLFGDFQLGVTTSLLIGCVPGAYIGARLSSRAPSGLIRRALIVVLVASGLKMFNLDPVTIGWLTVVLVVAGSLAWMGARRLRGLPALARTERRRKAGVPMSSGSVAEDRKVGDTRADDVPDRLRNR